MMNPTQEIALSLEDFRYGIKPESGNYVLEGGVWVPDKSVVSVSGFLSFIVKTEKNKVTTSCEITGFSRSQDITIYKCDVGESFYFVGSPPDGSYPMNPKLLDPSMVAPIISRYEELRNIDLGQATKALESEESKIRTVAAWQIWKILVSIELSSLLKTLREGRPDEKATVADRLGFILHPLVGPALAQAQYDPEESVRIVVNRAMRRLGLEPTERDSANKGEEINVVPAEKKKAPGKTDSKKPKSKKQRKTSISSRMYNLG